MWLKIFGVILQLHLASVSGGLPHQLDTPSVCVLAYQDWNRNGINDNEPPLVDVGVVLRNTDGMIVGELLTSETPRCFEALPFGGYQLWVEDGPYRILGPLAQPIVMSDEPQIIELAGLPANTPLANEICVVIFEDLNQDGVQDTNEALIGDFDVWLLSEDVIIATKLTSANKPNCFVGLEEGAYRVKIPTTPRHLMTTRSDVAPTFIGTGNRYNVTFGVLFTDPFSKDALLPGVSPDMGRLSLDNDTRLLLAIMGSGIVILLMIGVGSVAFAFWRR